MKENFTVTTYLVKETKNYWYYDIRLAFMKKGQDCPQVIGYEDMQNERPVTGRGLIKIKKTSSVEDTDRNKQIYAHFVNKYSGKGRKIAFIKF